MFLNFFQSMLELGIKTRKGISLDRILFHHFPTKLCTSTCHTFFLLKKFQMECYVTPITANFG